MLDLEAIKARRERTWEEMGTLCRNPQAWRMRIPVNEDDSDRVIAATCHDVDVLIAEVQRLQLFEIGYEKLKTELIRISDAWTRLIPAELKKSESTATTEPPSGI